MNQSNCPPAPLALRASGAGVFFTEAFLLAGPRFPWPGILVLRPLYDRTSLYACFGHRRLVVFWRVVDLIADLLLFGQAWKKSKRKIDDRDE